MFTLEKFERAVIKVLGKYDVTFDSETYRSEVGTTEGSINSLTVTAFWNGREVATYKLNSGLKTTIYVLYPYKGTFRPSCARRVRTVFGFIRKLKKVTESERQTYDTLMKLYNEQQDSVPNTEAQIECILRFVKYWDKFDIGKLIEKLSSRHSL